MKKEWNGDELANADDVVGEGSVGDAALGRVWNEATELFLRQLLTRHRLHHIRAYFFNLKVYFN